MQVTINFDEHMQDAFTLYGQFMPQDKEKAKEFIQQAIMDKLQKDKTDRRLVSLSKMLIDIESAKEFNEREGINKDLSIYDKYFKKGQKVLLADDRGDVIESYNPSNNYCKLKRTQGEIHINKVYVEL